MKIQIHNNFNMKFTKKKDKFNKNVISSIILRFFAHYIERVGHP
jgi:hypothetical protein